MGRRWLAYATLLSLMLAGTGEASELWRPLLPATGSVRPTGLAPLGNGLLLADEASGRLLLLHDGQLQPWGPAEPFSPRGIAVSGKTVAVADLWGGRVRLHDRQGLSLGEIANDLFTPWDVAFLPDGNLVIADAGASVVRRSSLSGRTLWQRGARGTATGEFLEPSGLAAAADGQVHVWDTFNRRVVRLGPQGLVAGGLSLAEMISEGRFADLALDGDGSLWLPLPTTHEVVRLGPDGEALTRVPAPPGSLPVSIALREESVVIGCLWAGQVFEAGREALAAAGVQAAIPAALLVAEAEPRPVATEPLPLRLLAEEREENPWPQRWTLALAAFAAIYGATYGGMALRARQSPSGEDQP